MKLFFKLTGVVVAIALLLLGHGGEAGVVIATTPYVDLAGSCQKILRQLSDLTKENTPMILGRKTGMLDFLTNPVNGSIKLDLNNVQEGKKFVKTKAVYKVRTKPSEIKEDAAIEDLCDDGAEPTELSVDVTINKRLSSPVRAFTNANMINICQDTNAFIMEYLLSDMRALREKADEYLLSQADSYKGRIKHQNGDTETRPGFSKSKKLLGTDSTIGTVVPLYANFADILLDYQNMQLGGYPHIIGEGNMQKFYTLQKFSCCNADGVAYDAAIASGAAFYVDQAANSMLGSNDVLVIAPNVLHLLWFNKNHNININSPLVQHIVIPDPIYPQLKWDMDFKWDECDEKWKYRMSCYLDMFSAIQTNAFGTDNSPSIAGEDELAGVTGVFGYTITA